MNTAFAYIGCSSIDGTHHTSISLGQKNSPGLCFTMCSRFKKPQAIVGLSQGKCFCLRGITSTDIHQPGCDLQNSGWVEGDEFTIMSLYEKKEIVGSGISNGGKCFAFDRYNRSIWKNCDQSNKSVCKTKQGNFIKVYQYGQQWHLPWADYIKLCTIKKCNPITYQDIQNRPQRLFELAVSSTWTRLIHSIVIYDYIDVNRTMSRGAYGYLKRNGGDVNLDFTQNGHEAKRALFETRPPSYKTTSMFSTLSSTAISLDSESASTRSSFPPETTEEDNRQDEAKLINHKPDVGITVGISVTVLIVVVAVIVVIVILKRRLKIQSNCFRKAESKCSAYDNSETIPGNKSDNQTSPGSSCDQIGELKPNSKQCTFNDETDDENNRHTYFILEKHTESHTDDNIIMTNAEIDNVYNTLNTNNGSKNWKNSKKVMSDNTYDTTENAAVKLNGHYNNDPGNCETEDTYNHTNTGAINKDKPDNVYGVPSTEGEYNDTFTVNAMPKLYTADTYSHVLNSHVLKKY